LAHSAVTAAGVLAAGLAVRPRSRPLAVLAASAWLALTGEFTLRRILPGPRTAGEIARMVVTSALIPPLAVWHRARGELAVRSRAGTRSPGAVLFDRDDTLIEDGPYLADADRVRPLPGALDALNMLRSAGVRVGIVTNQSGVARGLITDDQLAGVHARVERLLGPFDTWQVCPHGEQDDCLCRKPKPGLVRRAARALGTSPVDCVVIGDTGADVSAALAAGAWPILVPTARTKPDEIDRARRCACLAGDITEAVGLALDRVVAR
jgi:histidinol-phosphate phosphatase family protein